MPPERNRISLKSHIVQRIALALLVGSLPSLAWAGGQNALAVTPAPPVAPQVEARDGERVTIRATRLTGSLNIDGQLDEALYRDVQPIGNFVQLEPMAGAPSSEKTELWISFDDRNVYVSVRAWDSQPDAWILTEMRRDSTNISINEHVAFWFDTFYDRRNAVGFEVNALGANMDWQLSDGRFNRDWNPIWARRTGRFDGGWTMEAMIPFKSLRYRAGASQVWGFQMRRTIRHKNEETFLTRVPRRGGANARGSIGLVGNGATLVGIDAPSGSKNLEIKPYALSSLNTDRLARPTPVSNDPDGDIGFDVKYGVTQNLTADFTYRTDFAQVEVDEQQVNLTRFSLFYPEKRDFFLESAGIFEFGGIGTTTASDTPLLFFSRRIGLNNNSVIPIEAGGRLTGKVGRYTVGVLNVLAGDNEASRTPQTNFSVLRLRRDIFRRSSVGALYTRRSVASLGGGDGQSYGVDLALGLAPTLDLNAYLAKTETAGLPDDDNVSSRVNLNYNGGRYGLQVEHLRVGDNFSPDMGFLRRDDFRRSYVTGRFSPRLTNVPNIRRVSFEPSFDYLTDGRGRLETRIAAATVGFEFENNDTFKVLHNRQYEFLDAPFAIAPTVRLPIGGYSFQDTQVSYDMQNTHRFTGTVSLARGSFYNGDKTTLGVSAGRFNLTRQLAIEPGTSVNWVDLQQGSFTSSTLLTRLTFTPTTTMFFSGLGQYNSTNKTVSTNLRLRWEYRPGSEFFAVYTDERDTLARGFPDMRNRAFVVKINRLLRF